MWWTLLSTTQAETMRFCEHGLQNHARAAEVIGELEPMGLATVISPDGYAVTTSTALRGDDTTVHFSDASVAARVVATDGERVLLKLAATDRPCVPISMLDTWDIDVWSVRDGELVTGDRTDFQTTLPAPTRNGSPVLDSSGPLLWMEDAEGQRTLLNAHWYDDLDITWAFSGENRSGDPQTIWVVVGGVIAVVGAFWWVLANGILGDMGSRKVFGVRMGPKPVCPPEWVELAPSLGLQVDDAWLVGTKSGLDVEVVYENGQTSVIARCSPAHALQAMHIERAGSIREPLDLDNPVADGLIAVGGEPELIHRLQDEAFLGAVLAVVHAHPASVVDSEGVTLRAYGLRVADLHELVDAAVALARQL
ncbi:MAG: hypothetical protein GY913_30145 [Proteobacteria bacterium]|nr:hypothetical protein [Pseudomonadota bacterium]MCP4921179.1 hypothetical protein [Pseudomonadota bacterium]